MVERLRTWTDAGLLKPAGERNPGTGKPRQYDAAVVFDAAILNSLADAGFPIGKARYFMVVMLLAQRAKDAWERKRPPDLYLEVADFGTPTLKVEHTPCFCTRARSATTSAAGFIRDRKARTFWP